MFDTTQASPGAEPPEPVALWVSLMYRDRIVEDRTLRSPEDVLVGEGHACTFVLEAVGAEASGPILRFDGQSAILRFTSRTKGLIDLGGERFSLSDPQLPRSVRPLGACRVVRAEGDISEGLGYELRLWPGHWGAIVFGEASLIFTFVPHPDALRKHALPGSPMRQVARGATSLLGVAVLASLLLQGAILFVSHWSHDSAPLRGYAESFDHRHIEYLTDDISEAIPLELGPLLEGTHSARCVEPPEGNDGLAGVVDARLHRAHETSDD